MLVYQLEDSLSKSNDKFQLNYDTYNVTMAIERISLLDIFTDIRQAIITNDPSFMVRNEQEL